MVEHRVNYSSSTTTADYTFTKGAIGFIATFQLSAYITTTLNGVDITSKLVALTTRTGSYPYYYIGELKAGDVISTATGGFYYDLLTLDTQ